MFWMGLYLFLEMDATNATDIVLQLYLPTSSPNLGGGNVSKKTKRLQFGWHFIKITMPRWYTECVFCVHGHDLQNAKLAMLFLKEVFVCGLTVTLYHRTLCPWLTPSYIGTNLHSFQSHLIFLCAHQRFSVMFFFLRTGSHHLHVMSTDWNSHQGYKGLMSWRYVLLL